MLGLILLVFNMRNYSSIGVSWFLTDVVQIILYYNHNRLFFWCLFVSCGGSLGCKYYRFEWTGNWDVVGTIWKLLHNVVYSCFLSENIGSEPESGSKGGLLRRCAWSTIRNTSASLLPHQKLWNRDDSSTRQERNVEFCVTVGRAGILA